MTLTSSTRPSRPRQATGSELVSLRDLLESWTDELFQALAALAVLRIELCNLHFKENTPRDWEAAVDKLSMRVGVLDSSILELQTVITALYCRIERMEETS